MSGGWGHIQITHVAIKSGLQGWIVLHLSHTNVFIFYRSSIRDEKGKKVLHMTWSCVRSVQLCRFVNQVHFKIWYEEFCIKMFSLLFKSREIYTVTQAHCVCLQKKNNAHRKTTNKQHQTKTLNNNEEDKMANDGQNIQMMIINI